MGPRLYEGMSLREVSDYLFIQDDPSPADLIFVFGGRRPERAQKAVELYNQGLAPQILISGGDNRGTNVTEAEALKKLVVEAGVPNSAILLETESTNTLESVEKSTRLIEERIGWGNVKAVILVTSPAKMKRAKQTVARHIPREVKIYCVPDGRTDIAKDNWWTSEEGREAVFRELEKVRVYAHQGVV